MLRLQLEDVLTRPKWLEERKCLAGARTSELLASECREASRRQHERTDVSSGFRTCCKVASSPKLRVVERIAFAFERRREQRPVVCDQNNILWGRFEYGRIIQSESRIQGALNRQPTCNRKFSTPIPADEGDPAEGVACGRSASK
jgi:hypothetical protein